jgi:hypothetical protein
MNPHRTQKNLPWQQLLQHADLPGMEVEEFVGALEASAQASGARADHD